MKPRQIGSGFGHQCSQLRYEVQGFEYDMRRPIPIRSLQLVPHHSPGGQRQALF